MNSGDKMIIVLKDGHTEDQLNMLCDKLSGAGAKISVIGGKKTVLSLDNADDVDEESVRAYHFVESAVRLLMP